MSTMSTGRGLFGAPMALDLFKSRPVRVPMTEAEVLAPSTAQTPPAANMGLLAPSTHPELAQPRYEQRRLSTLDKVGLLADAFKGTNTNRQMLDQLEQRNFQQWQATSGQQLEEARQFARFKQQFDYQQANRAPTQNDTERDYQFRVQTLGKDAADAWLRSAGDPDITVTLPGNRVYSGPRSGLQQVLGAGATTNPMTNTETGTAGAGGLAPGTVVRGMRFKGGDYKDRANWETVGGGASTAANPFQR